MPRTPIFGRGPARCPSASSGASRMPNVTATMNASAAGIIDHALLPVCFPAVLLKPNAQGSAAGAELPLSHTLAPELRTRAVPPVRLQPVVRRWKATLCSVTNNFKLGAPIHTGEHFVHTTEHWVFNEILSTIFTL